VFSQFKKPAIALLVPAFALGGGVSVVAQFLYRAILDSGHYTPEIISLAVASRDGNSLCLSRPTSWLRGVRVTSGTYQNLPYQHVGAILSELEFQRYRPRRMLNNLLKDYALIQMVAGTPAWALVTKDCRQPVLLQVATLTMAERTTRLQRERGVKRLWRSLMARITAILDIRALYHTDTVFVENHWLHQQLKQWPGTQNIVFAPPGIDTSVFHSTVYQPNGYILSVGRFSDPRKNVRLLFQAYEQLRQSMSHIPDLILVGQPPQLQDWEYALSLGLGACINVYEDVSIQDLAVLYRGASLFVLSSNEEGLGLVILEAMASGLPVVSTRCGGPETAVIEGETGYLTPVGDAAALAQAMQRLLEDPTLRRRMGQVGRTVAEERFSIAAAGKVFLDRYDTLLSTGV
jgi:glycosyltransferase involved in cell wall biosynthesis